MQKKLLPKFNYMWDIWTDYIFFYNALMLYSCKSYVLFIYFIFFQL